MKRISVSRILWTFSLCVCAFFSGPATPAFAQNQDGSIAGTLTDPAGAVLRGAQVTITENGLNTATDQQGRFFLSGLSAGNYTLSISYIGFEKMTKSVPVSPGQSTSLKLQIRVACNNKSLL